MMISLSVTQVDDDGPSSSTNALTFVKLQRENVILVAQSIKQNGEVDQENEVGFRADFECSELEDILKQGQIADLSGKPYQVQSIRFMFNNKCHEFLTENFDVKVSEYAVA
ncbi:hypothetical protein EQG49_03030 [Periweissella cryptocerci]|uniref:Uncharacterized protein n=1 Tax=Periweissella cryptocerci TaxID=2506420 RepID=A0A4P6YS53_9LACO|nr:hypothetical protein [Periweissella cryptocerci]QBO35499.1 hypothetical protein EQG49_03030 [Periweissella cryptocerci]